MPTVESYLSGPEPHHRLLGWPKEVQGEMGLQRQLVTNGIYCGKPEGYRSKAAQALASGASDWLMLLQLDSDDIPGWMWGDAGCLCFWVRKQDLANRNFEGACAILQCY